MANEATYRKERKGYLGTKHIVECGDVLVRWGYQKRATGYPYLRGVALKPIHFSGNLADQIGDVLRWAERVAGDPDEQADLISARRRQLESRVAQAEKELAQAQKSLDEFAALAK